MSNSKRKAHCGKVKHASERAAQAALANTLKQTSKRGSPIVTYLTAYKYAIPVNTLSGVLNGAPSPSPMR